MKIARLYGEPQDGVANPEMASRWLKHLDGLCEEAVKLCPDSDIDRLVAGLGHEAVECFGINEPKAPLSVALAISTILTRTPTDAFGAEVELYCYAREKIVASLQHPAS